MCCTKVISTGRMRKRRKYEMSLQNNLNGCNLYEGDQI